MKIPWTPVWSLIQNRRRLIPSALCFYGKSGRGNSETFAFGDSNGCAAGATIEEAILQGFLELAERDAVCVWWENSLRRPGIRLDTVDIPYIREMSSYLSDRGKDFWLLDITNDLGIPAVAAVSCDSKTGRGITFGFGCHLNPAIAVMRAVTEHNQCSSGISREDEEKMRNKNKSDESLTVKWLLDASVRDNAIFISPCESRKRSFSDLAKLESDDIAEDVRHCVRIVEKLGLDFMVLDQTHPDLDVAVVKVFVPGLRHFWPRHAPGRLYDVPVKLGWLDRPRKEEELNSWKMHL